MQNLLYIINMISSEALGLDDVNFFKKFYDPFHPENKGKTSEGLTNFPGSLKFSHYFSSEDQYDRRIQGNIVRQFSLQ